MATTLELRKTPVPPLLRLPPVIRHRIYRFLGLASWNGSPFTFNLNGPCRRGSGLFWNWRREQNPRSFHGILLSCRDLHVEAATLLYSTNRFVLYYTNPGSLLPVFGLTPKTLSSLTALKIVLNQTSCHQQNQNHESAHCCLYEPIWGDVFLENECPPPSHSRAHQLPLLNLALGGNGDSSTAAAAQALLGEWRAAASYLSLYVTAKRLELGLVCDIDSQHDKAVDLAKSVMEPLRLFPLLKSCHIRLCKAPDSRLRQLAQDAALQSYGMSAPYLKPTSTKSAFVTLPRELRLRILELTDLVTPSREVWWTRDEPKYDWWDIGGTGRCVDKVLSYCQFNACWHRTHTHIRTLGGSSIGCFCHRQHAALFATCTCWAPPGPSLFLICRSLQLDAQLIFFSSNCFIVHDYRMLPPWSLPTIQVGYPYRHLAASQFLREVIPAHCITHLRFLELVFPPYLPRTWPETDHPAMRDWWTTVDWLQDKINGPALTLRLVVAQTSYEESPSEDTPMITVVEGDMVHRTYMDLLEPLKKLAEGADGLARFYADLPYPWERIGESRNRWAGDPEGAWLVEEERATNESAERQVMGQRYDRVNGDGRKKPAESLWQHVCYNHECY